MTALVEALRGFLLNEVSAKLRFDSSVRVQPVLVGPPKDVLEALFNVLTLEGSQDQHDSLTGQRIPILLVGADHEGQLAQRTLSARCTWDYAVSIRNSVQAALTLVTLDAWDLRPESIANATETIGRARVRRSDELLRSQPWPYLIGLAADRLHVGQPAVRHLLRFSYEDLKGMSNGLRQAAPWQVAARLLTAESPAEAFWAVGLPAAGDLPFTIDTLNTSHKLLETFATLCSKEGLSEAINKLDQINENLCATDHTWSDVRTHLSRLRQHLQNTAGSGSLFGQCPSMYFRPSAVTEWWSGLNISVLERLLSESGVSASPSRLILKGPGATNGQQLIPEEPLVFLDEVRLIAQDKTGTVPDNLQANRRVGRNVPHSLPVTGGFVADLTPPTHDKPLVYRATAPSYRAGDCKAISLSSYSLKGFLRIPDALKNPPPELESEAEGFIQEIQLARSGPQEVVIYRSPDSSEVTVIGEGFQRSGSTSPLHIVIDLEDGDSFEVKVKDNAGHVLGNWVVRITVEESSGDEPQSQFEALVRAHQEDKTRTRPVRSCDSIARRIENAYIRDARGSWRGVLLCWSGTDTLENLDFSSEVWGDLHPLSDIRPVLPDHGPSERYVDARFRLLEMLGTKRRSISELSLTDPEIISLVEDYLHQFRQWLQVDPVGAVWSDCVAVHAPLWNEQAGSYTLSSEPVALLISPFHPLRIAWHSHAQDVLQQALGTRRCPAAGLLNPHGSPGVVALPIFQGATLQRWRPFFAVGCNEPHWSLLWNEQYLSDTPDRKTVVAVLRAIGIVPTGLTGGFTVTQADRALRDVQSILSTRATLRIGLVGSGGESSNSVTGLIEWCRKTFARTDGNAQFSSFPRRCDVYDLRDEPIFPSSMTIAKLSDETGERVRWFSKGSSGSLPEMMDLVLLDQLGIANPQGIAEEYRSPMSSDALFRVNLRTDIGNGLVLRESRVARLPEAVPGLAGVIVSAVCEFEGTAQLATVSHLEFQPNREAINLRVQRSRFVAVTSNQVDPACFIRGAHGNAYLWDFELPGTMGLEEGRGGYYLIANPPPSLHTAIEAAARLVTDSSVNVASLLSEISSRGIPVLKRMASGGTRSRGELGVLLAVYLLQDCFRSPNSGVRLPIVNGECIHLLLPVDSYWEPLLRLRRTLDPGSSEERPDLLIFSIHIDRSGAIRLKVTPVEVKFREGVLSDHDATRALGQAANLGCLLDTMWSSDSDCPNDLWNICGKALLAQCLDQCFRVYADTCLHGLPAQDWSKKHEAVLQGVLDGTARVTVNKEGRLIVLDRSEYSAITDMDLDHQQDTVVICPTDAEVLILGQSDLSPQLLEVANLLGLTCDASSALRVNVDERIIEATDDTRTRDRDAEQTVERDDEADGNDEPSEGSISESSNAPVISGRIPAEVRQQVRDAFDSFIGNDAAVKRISNDLLRALIEMPPHLSKNYLLTGQPSTGKTELARRMARALSLPFVSLDGRSLTSRERLFELVKGELTLKGVRISQVGHQVGLPVLDYPPFIVLIDEVHLVPRSVQESLLTLLEAADRSVTLGNHVARVGRATFIFATTRASEVDPALRTRCAEVHLNEYDLGEVAEIVRRKKQQPWSREIYREIARYGRCVPRIALELADELETEITVSETPDLPVDGHLTEVRKGRGIDGEGLTLLDRQYLMVLAQEGRPLGEQTICNLLGTVDKDRVVDEIEPFLRRLGFIKMGSKGRAITELGAAYIRPFLRGPLR